VFEISNLEIHAWHGCNLACESCAHYSSLGFQGGPSAQMCEEWMELWADRLQPGTFSIVGGEPTLNRDLESIIQSAARLWPTSLIRIVTNGFMLGRHPGLVSLMDKLRGRAFIEISSHHSSDEFQRRFRPVKELAAEWKTRGVDIRVKPADARWTRRYMTNSNRIEFLDGDPRLAWESCVGKRCKQIYLGRLWKCPPIAYFGLWPSGVAVDAVWVDLAASYAPLPPDCSDDDLTEFLGREQEEVCRLCPSYLQHFDLPIPFKKRP
jgi:Radical SAM superfamily/4Fe-4S single cluster domain